MIERLARPRRPAAAQLVAALLLQGLPRGLPDLQVSRSDGTGGAATVLQDSAVGWDTTVYPHCLFEDNHEFGALDTTGDDIVDLAELTADGVPQILPMLDENGDSAVDPLEWASAAHVYISAKGLSPAAPNPNITCFACASGWSGQHCSVESAPVYIKVAVQASQTYFSGQKQEALRRALAVGVQWDQVRVVVHSVVTTEFEGQLMTAELLAGEEAGRGAPMDAAYFLANSGSTFYQETLWETLWYLHIVCPTNCSVYMEGAGRTWRTEVPASCTGPDESRVFALDRRGCENVRNDNTWLAEEPTRCEDRALACKDADGNPTANPTDEATCLGVAGRVWEPVIVSTGGTQVECETPPSGNLYSTEGCTDTSAAQIAAGAGGVPTARVVSANLGQDADGNTILATDSVACNALSDTAYTQGGGTEWCINSDGEKANLPLGQRGTEIVSGTWQIGGAFRTGCQGCASPLGPGQDADLPMWMTGDGQAACETTLTGYTWVDRVEAGCLICRDGSNTPVELEFVAAGGRDAIIAFKAACVAETGHSWEEHSTRTVRTISLPPPFQTAPLPPRVAAASWRWSLLRDGCMCKRCWVSSADSSHEIPSAVDDQAVCNPSPCMPCCCCCSSRQSCSDRKHFARRRRTSASGTQSRGTSG